eukprot:CAMPEP_0118921846 /NCGR_PEP_ID=MMETSP1169-20130426/993_1 /TAXON_ID=36882 /ORGANISM="Pyramimonas obovata, Strain CCMP722" /LENGTH=47 /DNA_ID= /DNA_START= /DNA_END= /DNA_ORIENTATION=
MASFCDIANSNSLSSMARTLPSTTNNRGGSYPNLRTARHIVQRAQEV